MKILITGTAGFIGYHTAKALIPLGHEITGIDSINGYYDVNLKLGRLKDSGFSTDDIEYGKICVSAENKSYRFIKLNLEDREKLLSLFKNEKFDAVLNLAAQAGVRYSIENPYAYADSNLTGFLNILEGCRSSEVKHLVFASSSSVYGLNETTPFSEDDNVDHPVSLYAATKKANELMAHAYSRLYAIPSTGIRFFTVYGPWGRPDMAYFSFTKDILEGRPINVFNNGNLKRDFTYIDDIVEGLVRVIAKPAEPAPLWSGKSPSPSGSVAPYRIYNIGNSCPVELGTFIEIIEAALGKNAVKNYLPMQPGDVYETSADTRSLERDFGFAPATPLEAGIKKFVEWYKNFYGI